MTTPRPDGRQVRWREHNEQRRLAIVTAAVAVLESQSPGDEIQVQAIADRAGLSRTVIYRHFEDRADLERAVQRAICEQIGTRLLGALLIDGTPKEIVHSVVEAFILWCVEHPSLFSFAEQDLTDWGTSPLADAMEQIALGIETVMNTVVDSVGAHLSEVDRAGLEPWVFAMIGGVFAGVRRWLGRPVLEPDVEDFVAMIAEVIWVQVDGMATLRGIELPETSIGDILGPLSGAG